MNNSNAVLNAMKTLVVADARTVAEHLDISTSSARHWLKQLESCGWLKSAHGTGFSDTGRQTNVIEYSLAPEVARQDKARVR
jgi:response regulator of citrate/malate metabolism